MKRRNATILSSGALRWSTTCILAGLGLSGCERNYVATAKDQQMAETQKRIETLDAQKAKLTSGEVQNNLYIEGVGYYHSLARDFFPHPYGFEHQGKWFVNGGWVGHPPVENESSSKPSPEALKKVQAALDREQQLLASQPGGGHSANNHGGFGMGNALLMYWLLSGSRGGFAAGPGFQRAATQAPAWQGEVERQRGAVNAHASANPGYRRMVEQSRASGVPVRSGQSVRGGFGSSRSGGGFSSGS
jgi:hypothetical protein